MTERPNWRAEDLEAIPPRVLAELESAGVEPGRPLIAVDADEVLVHFAEHFAEWVMEKGFEFELTEYRLDTAIRRDGEALSRDEIFPLVWGFVECETRRQRQIDGAAAALRRLAGVAQIVVLTNAPAQVRADRVANLAGLDMPFPVVMNEGGKGRALDWLASRANAPVAFIDDSGDQHASARRHAGDVARLHLVGSTMLKPIVGPAETADHHPHDWREAEDMIRQILGG
ncbi:HAD family hydrolase [Pikeienuella piscinae]|uniref:HAD family hydrolase n=1 Tax=Pikeienuella piscinae TaxID=2748098 RepID=A0A7L5BXP6_9RHOB|nr:HAD family hydrolase [Pikeienuella piscinae]QIE55913.1 HAD family hydrolase [Pikeienuella piscinae]